MSGRRTFLGNATAAVVITKISPLRSLGFATEGPETILPTMSDREKAGLRGPVAACFEEQDLNDAGKYSCTTEYSLDGKHVASRSIHPVGGESVSTFTYDDDGRLIKITGGPPNGPSTESLYTYSVQHDEQNRKIVTKGFDPETLQRAQGAMVCGSLWDAAVWSGVGVPVGGTLTLIHNNEDQPIEAQMRDGDGRIVNRLVRTYDANGRVLEEKRIQVNPEFDCETTEQEREFKNPEEEVMHRAMVLTLSGQLASGLSYTRDAQGRVIEERIGSFAFAKVTTTKYNEQGYKAEEQLAFIGKSVSPVGTLCSADENSTLTPSEPAAELPISVVRVVSDIAYSYEYDGNGNWTRQNWNARTRPNDPPIRVHRRTITYY
jgi:hypothetical protein